MKLLIIIAIWLGSCNDERAGTVGSAQRPGEPDPHRVFEIEVTPEDPTIGPGTAKVTIIELSDFACPFCARVAPVVKDLQKKYAKDVRLVFKQLPLPRHPQAPLAAEASLAAHQQGKFWEMHDKLFANHDVLAREAIETYARELGLDIDAFAVALDSGTFKPQIETDSALANQLGVRGTPAFFVNGRYVSGALPADAFEARIKEEIAR